MGTYKTDSIINRSHGILKQPGSEVEFITIMDHFIGRNIERAIAHFGDPDSEQEVDNSHKMVCFNKSLKSFNCDCSFTVNNVGVISEYQFERN